jgi:hypothetical protein
VTETSYGALCSLIPKFKNKKEYFSEVIYKFQEIPNFSSFSEEFSKIFVGFKNGKIGKSKSNFNFQEIFDISRNKNVTQSNTILNAVKKYSVHPHKGLIIHELIIMNLEIGCFSRSSDKCLMYSCVKNGAELSLEQYMFESNIRLAFSIFLITLVQ